MVSKMMMIFGALLLSGIANAHDYKVCKNTVDHMGLSAFNIEPLDSPFPGSEMTVALQGKPDREIASGKGHVSFKLMGIHIGSYEFDLCDNVECPLQPNEEFTVKVSQEIPSETPGGVEVSVEVKLKDGDEEVISCVDTKVSISKPKEGNLLGRNRIGWKHNSVSWFFEKWIHQFQVKINEEDLAKRASIFYSNLVKILEHNNDKTQTYKQGLNQFSHLSHEEFKNMMFSGGFNNKIAEERKAARLGDALIKPMPEFDLGDLPDEVDWIKKGAVTPVKNQGACGSCWAFSTTGSLEGAYFVKYGKLVSFSEQELVSCDQIDAGCNGGLMDQAFEFVEKNGLCREQDYTYESGSGMNAACERTCAPVEHSQVTTYVDVPSNERALMAAVAQQPVSVAIEADQLAFQHYKSGVLTTGCGTNLDHGVLVVGYGTLDGQDYWKVKNSWGPQWGSEGYLLIARGKRWPRGGECGILKQASYPVFN